MAATQGEARIVKAIIQFINVMPNAHAEKVWTGGGYTQAGRPDIDACVSGRSVKFECKRPGLSATPLQQHYLDIWQKAGALVGCVHSLDEAKALLVGAGLL